MRDAITLMMFICCAIAASQLLPTLNVSPDNRVFYHEDNERYQTLLSLEQDFDLYSNITFLIHNDKELNNNSASAIRWFSERLEGLEGYVTQHSLYNYPHISSNSDEITITSVLDSACPHKNECSSLFQTEKFEYLSETDHRLISPDRTAFAVSVAVDLRVGDSTALAHLINQIKEIENEFGDRFPRLALAHTGAIPMMQAFSDASSDDLGRLFPISILIMLVVGTLLFGSFFHSIATITLSTLNVVIIMGAASAFGLAINSVTSTLPLALLIISVSGSAHLICYINLRNNRTNPDRDSFRQLVIQSCNANRIPILLASLTTCLGLATLTLLEIPPFREFGLLAALGTVTNYLIILHVLPAAIRILPTPKKRKTLGLFDELINSYAGLIDQRKIPTKSILTIALIAMLGLVHFELDEDYIEYFDDSHDFRRGADLLNEKLASPYSLDIAIDYSTPNQALLEKNLASLEEFQNAVAQDSRVLNTLSIAQHMRRAKKFFSSNTGQESLDADYNQQIFLAYELSLPPGQSTAELISTNQQSLRISLLLGSVSSKQLISLESDIIELWRRDAHKFPEGTAFRISGETLPLAHLSEDSIKQVLVGGFVCLLFIFATAAISTRQIWLAIISVLAVATPLGVAFGTWAWFESGFGLATALVIAVTLGIIVDDTIHFLHRLNSGRRNHNLRISSAIGYAVHHSAAGIVTSSLILIVGFLVLCLSTFDVNKQFGIGVSLAITSALIFTLAGLPAALIATRKYLK